MDKEISQGLFEVENPTYELYDDMLKKYLGNVPEYGRTLFYSFIPKPDSLGGLFL